MNVTSKGNMVWKPIFKPYFLKKWVVGQKLVTRSGSKSRRTTFHGPFGKR